jgi:arsenite methyltransferase
MYSLVESGCNPARYRFIRASISSSVRGEMPAEIRRRVELWAGCIAGALEDSEYKAKLAAAGFEQIEVEATRVYTAADAPEFFAKNPDLGKFVQTAGGKFISAFIRACKPL